MRFGRHVVEFNYTSYQAHFQIVIRNLSFVLLRLNKLHTSILSSIGTPFTNTLIHQHQQQRAVHVQNSSSGSFLRVFEYIYFDRN